MGLFGDIDFNEVADDPFSVEAGTYNGVVSDFFVKATKSGDKMGMTVEYTVEESDNEEMLGRSHQEWMEVPMPADPKNPTPDERKQASRVKMRLASLGVPESRMNEVTPEDVIGTPITFTRTDTKDKRDDTRVYKNISNVKVRDGVTAASSGSTGANPFATLG